MDNTDDQGLTSPTRRFSPLPKWMNVHTSLDECSHLTSPVPAAQVIHDVLGAHIGQPQHALDDGVGGGVVDGKVLSGKQVPGQKDKRSMHGSWGRGGEGRAMGGQAVAACLPDPCLHLEEYPPHDALPQCIHPACGTRMLREILVKVTVSVRELSG